MFFFCPVYSLYSQKIWYKSDEVVSVKDLFHKKNILGLK